MFLTRNLLDESQLSLAECFDTNTTQPNFDQTQDQLTNYWIADGSSIPENFPTWWNDQMDGNLQISLQRDQPLEPYSSSNFMTFDGFNDDFLATTNIEASTSSVPEPGLWPNMSEQQTPLSMSSLPDPLPSENMEQPFLPLDQSPAESRATACSDIKWICNFCARSFPKKHLRT